MPKPFMQSVGVKPGTKLRWALHTADPEKIAATGNEVALVGLEPSGLIRVKGLGRRAEGLVYRVHAKQLVVP